ncbi:hypothetical protein [Hainan hebius popei torovirus]|uniref:Membrane glycoprotein n=1 Tax=Hainan hebius popei torovirus TaxID=2116385 RepID=A0A2P1GMW0_9NIDO|nr:hypothetical protein [Hainan hebius popei torovirus]AVM87343.1 hypothetical protein [Hainan hebius popei torovirus]
MENLLHGVHKFNRDLISRLVPIEDVVQVVAYCLCITVVFRCVLFKWPSLRTLPFITLVYNLIVVIQVVSLLAVFFLLPKPKTRIQIFLFVLVVFISIVVILNIIYKAVMFGYFLIKFRSFSIAVSGAHTLVIDGRCYPMVQDTGCIVIKKAVVNNECCYYWGDYVLVDSPKQISFWTWSGGVRYKYFSKSSESDCVFFIWTRSGVMTV